MVQFTMQSETCGGPITFTFCIDGTVVGSEAVRDGEFSAPYESAPGVRTVQAVFVGGSFHHDTTATLRYGQTFVAVVSPYCS